MGRYRFHLLVVLVSLTAIMQVVILYRQPRPPEVPSPSFWLLPLRAPKLIMRVASRLALNVAGEQPSTGGS